MRIVHSVLEQAKNRISLCRIPLLGKIVFIDSLRIKCMIQHDLWILKIVMEDLHSRFSSGVRSINQGSPFNPMTMNKAR